jgi:hypothetical protein
MKKFQKGDLVRFPAPMGLPDVFPINETKVGILIKKVDKLPEKGYYLYDRWIVLCGDEEHIVTESLLEKLNPVNKRKKQDENEE